MNAHDRYRIRTRTDSDANLRELNVFPSIVTARREARALALDATDERIFAIWDSRDRVTRESYQRYRDPMTGRTTARRIC